METILADSMQNQVHILERFIMEIRFTISGEMIVVFYGQERLRMLLEVDMDMELKLSGVYLFKRCKQRL